MSSPATGSTESTRPTLWLDGDVVACACPDCGAPMSVRIWLMVADCWRCGASIELTEEQEQEALALLEQRRNPAPPPVDKKPEPKPKPAEPVAQAPSVKKAPAEIAPAEKPVPAAKRPATAPAEKKRDPKRSSSREARRGDKRPRPSAPRAAPPVEAPTLETAPPLAGLAGGVQAPPVLARPAAAEEEEVEVWRLSWENVLAYLVSMVLHLLAMLLLALGTMPEKDRERLFVVTFEITATDGSSEEESSEDTLIAHHKADLELPSKQPPDEKPDKSQGDSQPTVAQIAGELQGLQVAPSVAPLSQGRGSIFAGRTQAGRTELVKREGGNQYSEAAVARGLQWLAAHQNLDGSWRLHGYANHPNCGGRCGQGQGQRQSDVAATALALLPFLGAGQTHRDGRYSDVVLRGLVWLVAHQQPNGSLMDGGQMYAHGQAAIALAEGYALSQDSNFRNPAQKAIDFIVAAQAQDGGWRYGPGQPGDTSVVGWQLMALRSGQMAGLEVPKTALARAEKFLDRVQTGSSAFSYMPGQPPTYTMTAEGMLCRQYTGWDSDHLGLQLGVRELLAKSPPVRDTANIYYWYYGTQVLHHVGGEYWDQWNATMRDTLVETQSTTGHTAGSWWLPAREGAINHFNTQGGRLFMTALSICTLEVYYRHLPLYRKTAIEP